jgi:hypothetical protein
MTTPEGDPVDLVEQSTSAARDDAASLTPVVPAEAPEADVLEQATPAGPGEHLAARDLPLESDEADAAEQAVVVELDEDDYR